MVDLWFKWMSLLKLFFLVVMFEWGNFNMCLSIVFVEMVGRVIFWE